MKKIIIALFFFLSYPAFAHDLKVTLNQAEQEAYNTLQPTFREYATYYLKAAYASQTIVGHCRTYNVPIPSYLMQSEDSEEPKPFKLLYVQKLILSDLNPDAASAINKIAFQDSEVLANAVERNLHLEEPKNKPIGWCIKAGTPIVERMLTYYNSNAKDIDISSFKEFLVAKKMLLEAESALNALSRRY